MIRLTPRDGKSKFICICLIAISCVTILTLQSVSASESDNDENTSSRSTWQSVKDWWHRPMFSPGTLSGMIYTLPSYTNNAPTNTNNYNYNNNYANVASRPSSIGSSISSWWNRPWFSQGTISGFLYNRNTGTVGGGYLYDPNGESLINNRVTQNLAFRPGTAMREWYNRPMWTQGTISGAIYNKNTHTVGGGYVYDPKGGSLINNPVTRNIAFTKTSWTRNNVVPFVKTHVLHTDKQWFDVGTFSGLIYTKPELAVKWVNENPGKKLPYLYRPYYSSELGLSVVEKGRNFGWTVTGWLTNDILHPHADKVKIAELNKGMEKMEWQDRIKYIAEHKEDYKHAGAISIDGGEGIGEMIIDKEAFQKNFPKDTQYYRGNLKVASQKPDYVGRKADVLYQYARDSHPGGKVNLAEFFISPDFMLRSTDKNITPETVKEVIGAIESEYGNGGVDQYGHEIRDSNDYFKALTGRLSAFSHGFNWIAMFSPQGTLEELKAHPGNNDLNSNMNNVYVFDPKDRFISLNLDFRSTADGIDKEVFDKMVASTIQNKGGQIRNVYDFVDKIVEGLEGVSSVSIRPDYTVGWDNKLSRIWLSQSPAKGEEEESALSAAEIRSKFISSDFKVESPGVSQYTVDNLIATTIAKYGNKISSPSDLAARVFRALEESTGTFYKTAYIENSVENKLVGLIINPDETPPSSTDPKYKYISPTISFSSEVPGIDKDIFYKVANTTLEKYGNEIKNTDDFLERVKQGFSDITSNNFSSVSMNDRNNRLSVFAIR